MLSTRASLCCAAFSKASFCLKGINATINRNNSPFEGKCVQQVPTTNQMVDCLLLELQRAEMQKQRKPRISRIIMDRFFPLIAQCG
jgi:hypothetical protein